MSLVTNIFRIPELRRRLFFTLGLLAVYRVGIFVTTPGVNRHVMRQVVQGQSGTFLGMFNLFSGGALEQLSIFALNIMPYVTASIILSLLAMVLGPLRELRKEGEAGQRKINQYTRYGTVVLSIVQGIGIAMYLEGLNGSADANGGDVVASPGWGFRIMTVIALTTGTAFLMWLGEQITERGIGNGISLIIFAGIVSGLPDAVFQTRELVRNGQLQPLDLLMFAGVAVAVTGAIVFFEQAQRRLPITYAKRGGAEQRSHLPLKVNMAGVIPPIFASSILMAPTTLSGLGVPGMEWLNSQLNQGGWIYLSIFVVLTVFFCFFYTAVTFEAVDVAENLKRQSAFIPSVRPGKSTADYIDRVLTLVTVGGAVYVATVCAIPTVLISYFQVPFYFGGTSLMIVVGVALDTAKQVEKHLIDRRYEGLTEERLGLSGRRA